MRAGSRKRRRYANGQRVRVWVGDTWCEGVVVNAIFASRTGFFYMIRFDGCTTDSTSIPECNVEPEDAVSRLGEIV